MLNSVNKIEELLPPHWASTESIKFQKDSTFAVELVSLIQQVIDYTNTFEKTDNANDALVKHTKIRTFMVKNIAPEMIKCILHHTGILVSSFNVPLPTSADSAFAIYVQLIDPKATIYKMLAVASDAADVELNGMKNESVSRILDIGYSLDRARGKIRSGIKDLKVNIGLPVGIFVAQDFLNKSAIVFTAEEIASAMLHEVGHIFAWMEYVTDMGYSGYYGNNVLRGIDAKFEHDPIGTISGVADVVEKASKSSDDPKANVTANKLAGILRTLSNKSGDPSASEEFGYSNSGIRFLFRTIVQSFIALFPLIFPIFISAFSVSRTLTDVFAKRNFYNTNKFSREVTSSGATTMFERLADEYVSRYRMSTHLNSALIKLHQVFDWSNFRKDPVFNGALRDSRVISLMYIVLATPSNLFGYIVCSIIFDEDSPYEHLQKRLERNISNTIDMLKGSDIDATTRNMLLEDIKQMKMEIGRPVGWAGRAFYRIMSTLINLPNTIPTTIINAIFGDTNMVSDYDKLSEYLEKISSSEARIHHAEITSIFDR